MLVEGCQQLKVDVTGEQIPAVVTRANVLDVFNRQPQPRREEFETGRIELEVSVNEWHSVSVLIQNNQLEVSIDGDLRYRCKLNPQYFGEFGMRLNLVAQLNGRDSAHVVSGGSQGPEIFLVPLDN